MSDNVQLQRSVTKIGGTELRPLHLPGQLTHQSDETSHLSNSEKQSKYNVLKRRFPVNNSKLSFEPRLLPPKRFKPFSTARTELRNHPKADYHEFLVFDQAGSALIGNDNTADCRLVAIKRKAWKCPPAFECMQEVRHENIVNLIDIFMKDEQVLLVYEQMDVSLELINGIPRGRWQAFEIAAICKEVLHGISFIHEDLNMHHGSIECCSILLSRDGSIKLANIGDCILQNHQLTDTTARKDICSVGFVMMELMESDTNIRNPNQIVLARPHAWKDESGIKDFLNATQTNSLDQLKKHHFLPQDSNRAQLKPHVFTALIAGKTDWDLIAPPSSELPRRLPSLLT